MSFSNYITLKRHCCHSHGSSVKCWNLPRNVKKKRFQDCIARDVTPSNMFHATCNVIKNSIKTASANFWCHIVSQKPIGSHSVYKHCETSCKGDVTLQCNAFKNELQSCRNRCKK